MFHWALNEYVTHLGFGKEVHGRNIHKLIRIFYFVSLSEALLLSTNASDWVGNNEFWREELGSPCLCTFMSYYSK